MPGLKVTREVHAEIRAIIAKNQGASNAEIARLAGVSDKTIKRVRTGGRYYSGYKRQLTQDHPWFTTDKDMPPSENMVVGEPMVRPPKKSLFERIGLRF